MHALGTTSEQTLQTPFCKSHETCWQDNLLWPPEMEENYDEDADPNLEFVARSQDRTPYIELYMHLQTIS
jgi:hypothetical protein